MTKLAGLVAAVTFVTIVGTANAAGYRFGVSDQAFYIPALSLGADPELFPRDRDVFEPQMRFWLGDELIGHFIAATHVELPVLFAALYLVTMALLTVGVVSMARGLGCDWWAIAVALALIVLRHRIARTGANSLEGYMHPRMLAFACGIVAFACLTRRRPLQATAWTALAAVVHTSTALWFGAVVAVAAAWPQRHRPAVRLLAAVAAAAGVVVAVAAAVSWPRMDPQWLAALGDRDYLFSLDWPVYAWISNLGYPCVLFAIYRRRRRLGVVVAGETGLVAGLLTLVALFLLSLPLVELRVAFFVQLQANRVFWVLDAVVAVYLAWWLAADVSRSWRRSSKLALTAGLAALAITRGSYVLADTGRPLAEFRERSAWTDAMTWLSRQPDHWHVLADPEHAWKYSVSVRAAALRDTVLERSKDPAMAMYDRALAMRVIERTADLGRFVEWTTVEEVRHVATQYDVDVFVDTTQRSFPLPVLFRNDAFVIYDLR